MTPRRLAFAAIAVVTVLCIVGVAIAAVAAGGSAIAYSVNGTQVSQRTFDQQLDDMGNTDNEKLKAQVSQTSGSVNSSVAAQLMTLNIIRDVLRDVAAERGVKVTDADRTAARKAAGSSIDGYPDSYVDLVVDVQTHATALGISSTDDLNAFLGGRFKRADVYVNPRYGFWNPRRGVCPPTGCSAAG
jgi:hypothetical protein